MMGVPVNHDSKHALTTAEHIKGMQPGRDHSADEKNELYAYCSIFLTMSSVTIYLFFHREISYGC